MDITENLTLTELWRIVRKRKYFILGISLPCILLVFLFTPNPPVVYSSHASLEFSPVKFTPNMSWDFFFNQDESANLYTQSRILTSQRIVFLTIKRIGLIEESIQYENFSLHPEVFNLVSSFQSKVTAAPVKVDRNQSLADILKVSVVTDDSSLSLTFVNILSEVFREESQKDHNKEINESKQFIENQLRIYTKELEISERKLVAYVKENLPAVNLQTGSIMDMQASYGGIKERESKYHSLKNKLLRRKNGEIKFEDWKTGINSISYGEDIFSSLIKLEQEKVRLLEYQKETSDQVLNIENQIKVTIDAAISALDEEMSTNQIRERGTLDLLERSLEFDHLQRDVALNESVVEHLSTSFQDVLIQASKEQEPVEVFEYAVTAIPIGSKRGKQVKLLSIALFPFLSIVLVVFMESQNTTLVMVEDVESFLDLTVLSIIPNIDHKDSSLSSKFKEIKDPVKARRLVVHYSPRSIQAEAFRSFRTNLDFMLMPGKGKTVLTTSSLMSEGKSNTLTNLAITYTQMNQRVLLVDCNMRRPTVHKTFGLDRGAGLVEILQESAKWQDNVKSIMDMVVGENVDLTDMMAGPGLDNLDVITSGSATPNPSGLLTTKIFAKFIEEVKSEYDIVLLDSPPLLHVTDASIIAPNVDAVVIIYEIGHTSKDALKRTKSILDNVKANIVGVVLNDIKSALDQSDYRSQYIKPYYSESANKKKIPFNLFSFFRKNPKQIEIDDIEIT